ncbi:MAG: class I SAM-dependent methyltransferase, partial [Bacteroidales bacterium]
MDIGCGFGRQAFKLAKEGFEVIGTDTNQDFINIAVDIFKKHSLKGTFFCGDLRDRFTDERFYQIILMEVLEHIPPFSRKKFVGTIRSYSQNNSKLIISIPRIKATFKMFLLNSSKYFTYPFSTKGEHPYPIPSEKSIKKMIKGSFEITDTIIHEETIFFICKSK